MKAGKKVLTYVAIILTAGLSALSYELFVFPNEFAPAGINGLCTMVQYALGIRVSVLNLLVNIPLALLVFKLVSRPLAIRSLAYTLAFSLALAILERVPLEQFAYATENGTSTILGPVVAGIDQRILLQCRHAGRLPYTGGLGLCGRFDPCQSAGV